MSMRISIICKSPIQHGAFGESVGNAVLCRRVRLVLPDGSRPRVPCVSGNALRGRLRRIVMRELLDQCGVSRENCPQWDRLYAALVNGGHLVNEMADRVVPEKIRALRESLPPLSLFGSALYSWMLPGHMSIGFLWPRCKETSALNLVSEPSDIPAEELVDEITQVRHVEREHQDTQRSGVTPMPVTMEAILPGVILESEISFARSVSDIERGCLGHSIRLLDSIGGKSGSGFGIVSAIGDAPDPDPYRNWLSQTPDLSKRVLDLASEHCAG